MRHDHPSSQPVRIFVCDDSRSWPVVLRYWLQDSDDLELVGVAHDRATALAALRETAADIVLLDTMAHGHEPLSVAEVRAAAPAARIVLYSGHSQEMAVQFVDGQPDTYLAKRDDREHFVDSLRELARP